MASHQVGFTYLSQENLLEAGCFDLRMAIEVAEKTMVAFENHRILFPEKIVQIFDPVAQDRINCLVGSAFLRDAILCHCQEPLQFRLGLRGRTASATRLHLLYNQHFENV